MRKVPSVRVRVWNEQVTFTQLTSGKPVYRQRGKHCDWCYIDNCMPAFLLLALLIRLLQQRSCDNRLKVCGLEERSWKLMQNLAEKFSGIRSPGRQSAEWRSISQPGLCWCGLGLSSSGQFRISESLLLILNPGFTARVRNMRWGKVAGGILFCVGYKMGTEHRLSNLKYR